MFYTEGLEAFNKELFSVINSVLDKELKLDIIEDENAYELRADLPGISKENIKISLESNHLKISVEEKIENDDKKRNYILKERKTSYQERIVYLKDISDDEDCVDASFENGVLTVKVKKKEKINKNIEIK